MKWRKKNKEQEILDTEFNTPQKMSNGNLYEVYNRLITQKDIDVSQLVNNKTSIKEVNSILKTLNQKYVKDFTFADYYLLMLHSNYFCSTIIFNCNNTELKRKMLEVIRYAWLNGKAGLYFDTRVNKAYGIIITNIEKNFTGDISKIEYWDMSLTENHTLEDLYGDGKKKKGIPCKIIEGEECKNVSIFKWGTLALSAYIIYYPFVRFQNNLLTMGIAQSFGYNKKYGRHISNPDEIIDEMELWYDSKNIFIAYTDEGNRYKPFENTSKSAEEFITFYKEIIGMYYALFGRRMNLDFKRERNTVEEVSLTSGSIDNIERDWLNEFELFCLDVVELNKKHKFFKGLKLNEIKLNNWLRQEMEEGEKISLGDPNKENKGEDNAN